MIIWIDRRRRDPDKSPRQRLASFYPLGPVFGKRGRGRILVFRPSDLKHWKLKRPSLLAPLTPSGAHRLGVHVERLVRKEPPAKGSRTGLTAYTLLIDGEPAGSIQTQLAFNNFISWSGLDIGRDRSSPVSHYEAPFEFTGQLLKVTVDMHEDQKLDGEGVGTAEMARQ
jgi:hypothetical protein